MAGRRFSRAIPIVVGLALNVLAVDVAALGVVLVPVAVLVLLAVHEEGKVLVVVLPVHQGREVVRGVATLQ